MTGRRRNYWENGRKGAMVAGGKGKKVQVQGKEARKKAFLGVWQDEVGDHWEIR